jgi:hypothetical protein
VPFQSGGALLVGMNRGWTDEDFQCATLYFFGLAGVDEVALRENQRACGKNLRLPVMGKGAIKKGSWSGHGLGW